MVRKLLCVALLGFGGAAIAQQPATLKSISEGYFQESFKASPSYATSLGIHDYDGELDAVDQASHQAQIARLKKTLAALSALDASQLTPIERDDREVFIAYLQGQLLEESEIRSWQHNPDDYVGLAFGAINQLISRGFDTPEARMKLAISRENQLPRMFKNAKANLRDMAPIFIDIALEDLEGGASFLQKDVPAAFAQVTDKKLDAELKASTAKAVAAMKDFTAFLEKEKPKAHGEFALGRDKFIGILRQDLIDVTPEQVLAAGEAQLERDRAAWDEVSKQIDAAHPEQAFSEIEAEHPSADKLISSAAEQLAELHKFIEDKHIVTFPSPILPKVMETPEFMRASVFGAMDWPGPFEAKAKESYYYITPPDPKSSPEEQEKFLRMWNYPTLLNLSVHEALPGHFTQGLFLGSHPEWSMIRKAAQSYSNAEGWAHYVEQMMVEQGLDSGKPKDRMGQLVDSLLRDCRLIDAVSMHVKGMSLEDATKTMRERCYIPEVEAYKEARRGTADPGYYSYTVGKLMILKLRGDLEAKEGANFSLQSFHDRFLSAGRVPIKVIRRELMGQDGPLL